MTLPAATVVICCYTEDRLALLLEGTAAVQGQLLDDDELIVVVDHNDALMARLAGLLPTGTALLTSTGPTGLSGARNTGVEAATGGIVVFLDDDAVPAPGWLVELRAPYADPTVQAVGGRALPRWQTGRPRWWPAEFDWVVGCHYRGLPEVLAPVRNLLGASMSIRSEAFATVGTFTTGVGRSRAGLPMGCEETELCIRISQNDPRARILLAPDSTVAHHVPAERATLRYFLRRCWAEGLSKAAVAGLVGSQDGLASERRYACVVLPLAVLRGLGDPLRGDPAGLIRAGAVLAGLTATTAGYLLGRRRLTSSTRTEQLAA